MLYNVALCKVRLWWATFPMASHPAQHGAGQSDSHAPTGYAGCRLPPLVLQYSQSPIPKITPSPITAPACVRSGLSRFLQAKRACRASPPLLASRSSTVIRRPRKSGNSPCQSTGKANIQIVARLCRAPASNQPQKNTHPPAREQAGAGQSNSDAPQAPLAADCRPSQSTIYKQQRTGCRESGLPHSLNQYHTCPSKKRP